MWRKLLRVALLAVYFAGLLGVAGLTAYAAFSQFVRRGVTPVPDLVGLPLSEAEALLVDQGLRMRWLEGEDRFDDSVPSDQVLQHNPGPGSLVKKASTVDVVLSLGRQLVEVPDLSGQALQAAQVNLAAAGLSFGRQGSIYTDHGAVGTVVGQGPPPGSLVDRATSVDLLISLDNTAETYVMPDLIYRTDAEVKRFFRRHGFRLGSVKYEPYEGVGEGIVLRQYPLAGHPLRRRDVIALVVAASPESASP